MAIQYLSRTKAKLIVSVGSASRGTRKQYTKTVTIKGKKDAQRQYELFEAECKSCSLDVGSVGELVDTYIAMQRLKGLKETTLKGYESHAKRIDSAFKGIKPQDLTTYQIERFIASAVKGDPKSKYPKKASPKTIRNIISLLSSSYRMAVRSGLLQSNPAAEVLLPKRVKKEKVILKRDEIQKFVSALDDTTLDLKVVYELALFGGLRRSEIMGLTVDDISTVWGTVSIKKTRHRIDRKDVIQDTKTESSRRTITLPDFVMKDVAELIRQHEADPYIENDFLIQYAAEPMRPDYAKRQIKVFTAEHGLPDVTLHGLRHTYASLLHDAMQFDAAEISAALGHSAISTTLNIYTHMFDDAPRSSRRIADFLQKGFQKVSPDNEKTAETL